MFSSDEDFLERIKTHLHKTSDALLDKGDVIYNADIKDHFETFRDAAILFSIIKREEGFTTLLNLRPKHLANHAGQVGFPGGKVEKGDENYIATVYREAMEEIGLSSHQIKPLGFLDAYLTGSGFRVIPVLALVETPFNLVLDEGEVEEAFEVPFSFLMNTSNHEVGFLEWRGKKRFYHQMPYKAEVKDWHIWGVTAGIIRLLYETLYPDFSPDFPIEKPYLTGLK